MKRRSTKLQIGGMGLGLFSCAIIIATNPAYAFPENHWVLQSGEQLEVLRDSKCFDEGKASIHENGEVYSETFKTVTFDKDVLSAEVVISGFNMWYPRGNDNHVARERVDAFVVPFSGEFQKKNQVTVRLLYVLEDDDRSSDDDITKACIGFTVIARTK